MKSKIAIGSILGTVIGTGLAFGFSIIVALFRMNRILSGAQKPVVAAVGIIDWNLLILGALLGCCIGALIGRHISKQSRNQT